MDHRDVLFFNWRSGKDSAKAFGSDDITLNLLLSADVLWYVTVRNPVKFKFSPRGMHVRGKNFKLKFHRSPHGDGYSCDITDGAATITLMVPEEKMQAIRRGLNELLKKYPHKKLEGKSVSFDPKILRA